MVSTILFQGCGKKAASSTGGYDMGEKVRVGPLTYTVLEADWKSQLGEFPVSRVAEQNFLLIRISVTNSGGNAVNIPSFTLESSRGDSYTEVQDVRGVERWLGIFRNLNPAMTEDGWILFDVPKNSYRVKLTDPEATDPEAGVFVKIPLRME